MIYPTTIEEFDLGKWGKVKFAQWNHPNEVRKEFNEAQIDWFAQFIKPGDIAIDIGAFTGDTTLPMAVAAGKTGIVYAFEPNPVALHVLLQNSPLNHHIAAIVVCAYAIGVRREQRIFRYHCGQINGGFLTEGDPVTVQSIRLDEAEIEGPVRYVKIDCEGEDGLLLAEFTPWLKNSKAVVQVERFPYLKPDQEAQLWNAITAYGRPYIKDDYGFTQLKELPKAICDIVIIPK